MSVLCLCYTCFGLCLVLSPMRIVRLNQKIFDSFNCTVSHNILHNSVFKRELPPLDSLAHQLQQRLWHDMNQSYPTSFKTLEKVRFLTGLWLFPSIFLKGRVSSGFIVIPTRAVCAIPGWELCPQRGFAHSSAPALQSCSPALSRGLCWEKHSSLELQKDKLNKTISAHWTDHIPDHVCVEGTKPPTERKWILYVTSHIICFNFRDLEKYLMTYLLYKSPNFCDLNLYTIFSKEWEENPTSPCYVLLKSQFSMDLNTDRYHCSCYTNIEIFLNRVFWNKH